MSVLSRVGAARTSPTRARAAGCSTPTPNIPASKASAAVHTRAASRRAATRHPDPHTRLRPARPVLLGGAAPELGAPTSPPPVRPRVDPGRGRAPPKVSPHRHRGGPPPRGGHLEGGRPRHEPLRVPR